MGHFAEGPRKQRFTVDGCYQEVKAILWLDISIILLCKEGKNKAVIAQAAAGTHVIRERGLFGIPWGFPGDRILVCA